MSDDYVRWEGSDGSEAWEATMSYGVNVPWWVQEAARERAEAAEVSGVSGVMRGSVGDRIRAADPLLFAELVNRGVVDADGLLRLIRDECRLGVTSSECDVANNAAVLSVLWARLARVARWVDAYLGVVDVTDDVVEGLAQRVADDVARTIRGYLDGQG